MDEKIHELDKPRTYEQYEHAGNQPDVYVRCPYFPEHELRRSRLPYHLIKCQANPRGPKLLVCPYNYLHRVKAEDRHEHAIMCEDRVYHKFSEREPPSVGRTRAQLALQDKSGSDRTSDANLSGDESW